MKVVVDIQRTFEMAEKRILAEPGFAPPPADASEDEKRAWLKESFFELCGIDRDQDHIDGSYVAHVEDEEYVDVDFQWPKS